MSNENKPLTQNEEAIALQQFVNYAEDDIKHGRVMSSSALKERLSQRKDSLSGETNEQ